MGTLGRLVTGADSERRAARRRAGGRSALHWSIVALASVLSAAVLAVGASVALQYTQTELADVIGISADEVFEQQGRVRLGVGLAGFVVLLAVAPGLLVGGVAVLCAGLRGWSMVAPPLLAGVLGLLGSAVGSALQVGVGGQLGVAAAGMGIGALLGAAAADLVRPREP